MKIYKVKIKEVKEHTIMVTAKSKEEARNYVNISKAEIWDEPNILNVKSRDCDEIKIPSDIPLEVPLEYLPFGTDEYTEREFNLFEILWEKKINKIWSIFYKKVKDKRYKDDEEEDNDYEKFYTKKVKLLRDEFNEERLN